MKVIQFQNLRLPGHCDLSVHARTVFLPVHSSSQKFWVKVGSLGLNPGSNVGPYKLLVLLELHFYHVELRHLLILHYRETDAQIGDIIFAISYNW